MKSIPAVAVVIPAFNAGRYVGTALESLANQTHTDFEVIVVDDGSTDDTAARVLAVPDERFRLIRMETNSGPSAARNRALQETEAPVIALLDADDECSPERLATQLRFLHENPDIDVVGSAITVVDEAGRPFGTRHYPNHHEAILRRFPSASPVATPSVAVRRNVLLTAGGFRSEWEPAEDYELWSRLAHQGRRFANCPHQLVRYRVHKRATKSTALRRQLRMTLKVKKQYWHAGQSFVGRLRYAVERTLLLAPPWLVFRLFLLTAYRPVKRGARKPRT